MAASESVRARLWDDLRLPRLRRAGKAREIAALTSSGESNLVPRPVSRTCENKYIRLQKPAEVPKSRPDRLATFLKRPASKLFSKLNASVHMDSKISEDAPERSLDETLLLGTEEWWLFGCIYSLGSTQYERGFRIRSFGFRVQGLETNLLQKIDDVDEKWKGEPFLKEKGVEVRVEGAGDWVGLRVWV